MSESGQGQGQGQGQRYVREERIAVGGMGEVWRARDTVLDREVAVKLLKPEYAQDATFRQRFDAEARNAAALHHPSIATVFDFGDEPTADGPRPFLVMELVKGRPLSDLLQAGRAMPPEQARRVVTQVAEALAQAHAVGMVHRDVKPANILVLPDGRVKVTDFGIARAADASALTGTGEMIGTPHYISPEQARGQSATPASDVYSLGVVLYELLAGTRPFVADTPVATALAHIGEPPPDLPAGVPADLREIVRRSLAKDPAQRFPDAAALATALGARDVPEVPEADAPTQAVAAAPLPDVGHTAVLPAVAPVDPVDPVTPVADLGDRTDRRRRRDGTGLTPWWIVIGLVVLIVIVAAVVLAKRSSGNDDQPTTPTTPTSSDTGSPTSSPTKASPTKAPSTSPSRTPSKTPSRTPSKSPTKSTPTEQPSQTPTPQPSDTASASPTQ